MKKLLVFSAGRIQDRFELDDYLYDSEVIRSDYIDLNPEDRFQHIFPKAMVDVSEWEMIFKGSEEFDFWHTLVVSEDSYDFEEYKHKASIQLMKPYLSEHVVITAVIHVNNHHVVVYRLKKAVSKVLNQHLKFILESFDGEKYNYSIPENVLGSALLSIPKEEAD